MAYKLTNTSAIVRMWDEAVIPSDQANLDYAEYLKWLAAGNTPQPADVPDPKIAIQQQIDTLETQSLMNRGSRELAMRQIEQQAQIEATAENTADAILAAQPFYVKLKALDDQISALRVQL